jgi:hypothetical protein
MKEVWRSLLVWSAALLFHLTAHPPVPLGWIHKNFVKECNLLKKAARHCRPFCQKIATASNVATSCSINFL